MSDKRGPSTLVVGLAFFSMFFGSGNLIFPLLLGAKFEGYFLIAAAGFIITAVILPTLGILAMVPARGRYENLFAGLLPEKFSLWFFLILLTFWIPLGSGPRCAVLAHASINRYLPMPLWLFSFIFLALVYIFVQRKTRLIDVLGKYLTPALLLSIFFMVIMSFSHGDISAPARNPFLVFMESAVDGYYTQDLIAAVFFASAIATMLSPKGEDGALAIKKTFFGGLLAALMLAIIYISLMAASAIHAESLRGLSGEKLVSTLAHIALGPTLGAMSSVAVTLACFTTEIALVVVFADFLERHVFQGQRARPWPMLITLVIIWSMAQLEFAGIMAVVAPAMKVIYPILFFLVLRLIWRSRRPMSSPPH